MKKLKLLWWLDNDNRNPCIVYYGDEKKQVKSSNILRAVWKLEEVA